MFQNNYSIFAFNEKQQASAVEEIVKTIENDGEIRLLTVHNLTRFVETSKKPDEARRTLKEVIGVLKRATRRNDVALVASGASTPSRRRIPKPIGGTFLRHEANVMLYLKRGEGGVSPVWAYLLKHPYRKTPQKMTLYVSRGGIDLMGRVTPSFRQLYHAQIQELKKHFQNTLLDLGHREAFNLLLKEAWTPEDHALSNAKVPYVLDVLNLMGNVHLMKEIAALRRKTKELEAKLNAEDGGGGTKETKR